MGSPDISRRSSDPRKRYTGVNMQQGRVLLDSDWNEQGQIAEEARRQHYLDTIGAAGTPDDGFKISNLNVVSIGGESFYNFDIEPGTFYLGGHRLEQRNDAVTSSAPMTFLEQTDWLQLIDLNNSFSPPSSARDDLAVLFSYPQDVTAVEDSELLEVALGGPDTTTRRRMLQRIQVFEGLSGNTCEELWQDLLTDLRDQGWGVFDANTNTWNTKAALKVSFAPNSGQTTNPCAPPVQQGYLGPENQAIRVQVTGVGSTFTWGFDNASTLYRVQIVGGDRKKLKLLTPPRDQAHWPLAQQVVEILPWTSYLPNKEKVADMNGSFTRVSTTYNPDTQEIVINDDVPVAFDQWENRQDQSSISSLPDAYYYLRLWDRGSDTTSDPEIAITPNTDIALGNTGLQVQFLQVNADPDYNLRAGDHWVLAARPDTPEKVTPWLLDNDGKTPDGPSRMMAPLARISWQDSSPLTASVVDCRRRFRPLLEQHQCCSLSVGDGIESFGDYNNLEDAIGALPPGHSKICLLPGWHEASISLENKGYITIEGCGPRSFLIPSEIDGQRNTPIFSLTNCSEITLENLSLASFESNVVQSFVDQESLLAEGITIRNCQIISTGGNLFEDSKNLCLENNNIRILDKTHPLPGIQILSQGGKVQNNQICVVPKSQVPTIILDGLPDPLETNDLAAFYANKTVVTNYAAFTWGFSFNNLTLPTLLVGQYAYLTPGGIQVMGGSEDMDILNNKVYGGSNNGITLGSTPLSTNPPGGTYNYTTDALSITKSVEGFVKDGENAIANLPLFLREDGGSGKTYFAVTDEKGYWVINSITTGSYKLTIVNREHPLVVTSPVTILPGTPEFDQFDVSVQSVVPTMSYSEFKELQFLAFVSNLRLEENSIGYMGQSGIGVPYVDPTDFSNAMTGFPIPAAVPLLDSTLDTIGFCNGFVRNVQIRDNVIFQCLQNSFDPVVPEPSLVQRGVGGISLGLCDEIAIEGNRIEANGTSYLGPANGIFVMYGQSLSINNNNLSNNGRLAKDISQVGYTGGILIYLSAASQRNASEGSQVLAFPRAEKHALQLHHNTIDQPLGRTCSLQALGPVFLQGNDFRSQTAMAISPLTDQRISVTEGQSIFGALGALANVAGNVFLYAVGETSSSQPLQVSPVGSNGDGESTPLFNGLAYMEGLSVTFLPLSDVILVGNQVRMGTAGDDCNTNLVLFSANSIVHCNNTSDVHFCPNLIANNVLYGSMVQASQNRLQEPMYSFPATPYPPSTAARLSMLSAGLMMNNTCQNTGNHCTLAYGGYDGFRLVNENNLALFAASTSCSVGLADVSTAVKEVSDTFYVPVLTTVSS